MGFSVALTTDQYNLLRGNSYASDWLAWVCTNAVVFSGTIADTLSSDPTWAQFDYATVASGSYTDVEYGQAVLMSDTNDITTASYRGRIRENGADATTVYVKESDASFSPGAYFWVIDTYDLTYRAWRPSTLDPVTAEPLIDYGITYRGMQPSIKGTAAHPLRTAYVGKVDPLSTKMRITFDVSDSFAAESGATITGYQFTFKASTYTVVSGSLSTAIVTVDIDDNTEQWGKLEVTDSNGVVATRRFYVSTLPPVTGFGNATLSSTLEQGWTLKLPAFTDVDDLLNNTFIVLARDSELFEGTPDTLFDDNNVMFVGWLQSESDNLKPSMSYGILSPSSFEFTGVAARMARLVNQPFVFEENAAPSVWGQVTGLAPCRAIKNYLDYFSTVTLLCELSFDSFDTTFAFPDITTQGANLLDSVQGMAKQIDALCEFAPDGRIGVFRDFTYLTQTERDALVVVADWQAQDASSPDGIQKSQEENPDVGKVDGSGAFSFTSVAQVQAFTCRAPSLAQGESQGTSTLNAQILAATDTPDDALAELKQRVGDKLVYENNNLYLDVSHLDPYYVFIPSHSEFFTWTLDETIPGLNGIHRVLYDTTFKWVLESVSYTRAARGKTRVKARYHYVQPPGTPGVNTTQQPQAIDPLPDLGIPAFNFELPSFPDLGLPNINPAQTQPPKGRVAKIDGNTLLAWASNQLFLLGNVIALTTPTQRSIQPPGLGSFLHRSAIFDPLNRAITPTTQAPNPNHRAYTLVSDGTDSKVVRTEDVFVPVPTWIAGASVAGLYTLVRGTNADGGLMIYKPGTNSNPWQHDDNFVSSPGDWILYTGATPPSDAAYTPGVGFTCDNANRGVGDGVLQIDYIPSCDFFCTEVSATVEVSTNSTEGEFVLTGPDGVTFHPFGSWSGTQTFTAYPNRLLSDVGVDNNISTNGVSVKILAVTVKGLGSNPFNSECGGAGNAIVRYSSDRGNSWGSEITIGSSPGVPGGFDVSRANGVSYAACAGKVRKASSLGGAYSDFVSFTGANPVCVVIPYYRLGSNTTSQTADSDPDLLVALDKADSGGGTLYKINGATGAKTDITPVAGMVFDNANCITVLRGTKIAVFGKVSGAYKLYVTENTGSSWTLVGTRTAPKFIRDRRNDPSNGANKGQLFLADNTNKLEFSSKWASNGVFPRNLSFNILGLDPLN